MNLERFLSMPVVKPLHALLHSRRFIMACIVFGVSYAVVKEPSLAPYASTLIFALTTLASVLILGTSYEDASKNGLAATTLSLSDATTELKQDVQSAGADVVKAVIPPDGASNNG